MWELIYTAGMSVHNFRLSLVGWPNLFQATQFQVYHGYSVRSITLFTVNFLICITMYLKLDVRQFWAETAKLPEIVSHPHSNTLQRINQKSWLWKGILSRVIRVLILVCTWEEHSLELNSKGDFYWLYGVNCKSYNVGCHASNQQVFATSLCIHSVWIGKRFTWVIMLVSQQCLSIQSECLHLK